MIVPHSYRAACPKCGKQFNGPSIGSHSTKCGLTMADLFWVKVDKNGAGGCWNWMASRKPKGYGQFLWQDKMHRAHRLAWTLTGRELQAKGLELAHRCDNRVCVNPDHLFIATHAENMADCKAKKRHTHGEANIHAKLTEAQVLEIRANPPKLGRGFREINEYAARYGVSVGTIYCSMTGRTWSHIK